MTYAAYIDGLQAAFPRAFADFATYIALFEQRMQAVGLYARLPASLQEQLLIDFLEEKGFSFFEQKIDRQRIMIAFRHLEN